MNMISASLSNEHSFVIIHGIISERVAVITRHNSNHSNFMHMHIYKIFLSLMMEQSMEYDTHVLYMPYSSWVNFELHN